MAFISKYGVARHIYIPMIKRAVVDFAVSADWTPAAGDVKISKDGGAAANVTNLPTAITMGNTAMWDFSMTATEMQAAQVLVTVADSATKAVEDTMFAIETHGHASAQFQVDLADSIRAGLTALPNAAAEAAGGLFTRGTGAGQIEQEANGKVSINVKQWLGGVIPAVNVTGVPKVDLVDWLGAAPAALSASGYVQAMLLRWLTDNAGGTPDALSAGKLAADLKLWLASAPNALIAGRVDANAQAMAANVITAGVVATDAIDADALATDAVNELRDAIFARAFSAAYSALTFDQIVKLCVVALAAKCSGMGTATGTFRNLADTADAIVASIDASGNRTAVTLTP